MSALPGTQLCIDHQGNHSHYDPHNCVICSAQKLDAAIEALRAAKRGKGSTFAWMTINGAQEALRQNLKDMNA